MAEPVIVPIVPKVVDVDMSEMNFDDVSKEITKSMRGIKAAIEDAFSGINPSAINKPIEKSMTAVTKSIQAAENAQLRVNEAMVRAGKSSEEYKSKMSEANAMIANQQVLVNELSKLGPAVAPALAEAKRDLQALIEARNSINPLDFVDSAEPIQLERIASAYNKFLSAQATVNKKSEEFNQTAHDNRWSDEYAQLLKDGEEYKKKLDELNEKSKRMEALGATDKQWEALSYDLKQASTGMDDVIKKMKIAKDTGTAFRFGSGDKREVNNQINSFAMSNRNNRKYVGQRITGNQSPFTEEFQKSLNELDKLEKKMQTLKAKSDKMIELGASKKQFEAVNYEAQTLKAQIEELRNQIMNTPALKFHTEGSEEQLRNTLDGVNNKANELQDGLDGVSLDAKKAQGGLVKLGATHPKLAAVLGVALKIGKGLATVGKVAGTVAHGVGKVASAVGRAASGLVSGLKNMLSFGKAGRGTSNDLNGRFKKLGKNIMMFGLGFRTAYYLIKRLRNIAIEGFTVMGDKFDEVGAPMKTMIESFNRLKGSIATAFQPIASVVIPILTRFMNYLSGVLEKIGEFTAVLTGQNRIYKAVAKSVNSVAGAAKNANNQLGSYDKLEVIQDNKVGYDYEEQSVGDAESAASNFANMVKEAWENADFTGVGEYVTAQLLGIFDMVETKVIPKVTTFVNKVLKSFNTFVSGFDAIKLGAKVGSIINTLVSGLDWAQIGAAFANINNIVWRFVYGLVTDLDWVTLGTSLADGFVSMFNNLDLNSWADMVVNLINGLTTFITTVVENVDWDYVLNTLLDKIEYILSSVGESMSSSENPILSAFGEVILAIGDAVEALRPAIEAIISAIGPIIQEILPIISALLPPIAEIISDVITTLLPPLLDLIKALSPIIVRLLNVLMPIIDDVLSVVSVILADIINFITNAVVPTLDILVGVFEFVFGTIGTLFQALNGDFDSFGDFFSTLLSKWKGPINSILGAVENLVNGINKGINALIRGLNKIKIPNWSIFGDMAGASLNIPELKNVSIPRLAQGAVIPPNKEFLAMLGDQKSGTNIEAPLDTIKQALAEVLAEVGGGTREPIVLQVSGRTLAKVVWDEQEKRYKQTGKSMA